MAFLCRKHFTQLSKNPIKALSHWQDWIKQGSNHMRANDLKAALQYFGCAFEISEMLLMQHCSFIETRLKRIDRFMLTGFYLAEIYKRKGKRNIEGQLLIHIYNCLETFSKQDELLAKRLQGNMEFSALMIEKFNARSDELLREREGNVYNLASRSAALKSVSIH